MKFRIVTLFPEAFDSPLSSSILKRARDKGVFEVEFVNLRNFGLGSRKQVDDTPYGGGPGMILRVDVMARAIASARENWPQAKVVLLTPQGKIFNQKIAREYARKKPNLILVCGHYEGFDERIRDLVDEEISVGQYVLTGGELAAMVLVESIVRLLPEALGRNESVQEETFSKEGVIEYPQYTRPDEWQGQKVPEVLLSGNHQKIKKWREVKSAKKSKKHRKS
jgi:tRNA (guanine37-N1)-methyltransferase